MYFPGSTRNDNSYLDNLESRLSKLRWSIDENQRRGILGPRIFVDDDNLFVPLELNKPEVDAVHVYFHEQLNTINRELKELRNDLAEHAFNNHAAEDIRLLWPFSLLPFSRRQSDDFFCRARRANEKVQDLGDELQEVVKRRLPYLRCYRCAFYARLLLDETDRKYTILRNRHGKSKAEQHKFCSRYSPQTNYEQSRDLYICGKQIVSILERLRSDMACIQDETLLAIGKDILVPKIAGMVEKSLRQYNKYPHSIIAASDLPHYVTLSSQLLSRATHGNLNLKERTKELNEIHSWTQKWDTALKSLGELYNTLLVRKMEHGDNIGPDGGHFLQRARLINLEFASKDLTGLCERERVTLDTIGPKIAHAYPDKMLFDKPPDEKECTALNGSCGKVYKVKLPAPKQFIISIDTDGREEWRTLTCDRANHRAGSSEEDSYYPSLIRNQSMRGKFSIIGWFHRNNVWGKQRILRELEMRVALKNECILPLFGLWNNFDEESPNYPLLVSPWMDEGDLHSYIERNPKTTLYARLAFLRDIASALSYMHGHHDVELVHGDLKADNVLVDKGRAYLHDFGKANIADGNDTLRTEKPSACWRWQAPELMDVHRGTPASEIRPTPHSDMYAYGSLFLEVLTGKSPWDSPDALSFRIKNRSKIQKRPSGVRDDRHWVLMKHCWMEEPTLRLTAQDALVKLYSLLAEEMPHR